MFYVQESLGQGERLVRFAHFHWLYTVSAALMIVWGALGAIAVIVGAIMLYMQMGWIRVEMDLWSKLYTLHWGIRTLAFGVLLYGFYNFVHMMVLRVSTEVAITTRRLVYKRGLIRRAVDEMNIDRIEGVMVRQSILGRILGYGSVVVHGMGVGQVILPTIADPIAFRRAAQHAREYAEADQVQAGRA